MREFEYLFKEGLSVGLRKHHKNPRNNQALIEAMNVKCAEGGLEPYVELGNDFDNLTTVWPYPQLLCGSEHTYLITRDPIMEVCRIYEVNADFSVTIRFDVDDLTFGAGGGRFELVDAYGYQLLMNGKAIIRRNPLTDSYNGYTSHAKLPLCRTLCNYKGQMFGGNVQSSWYDCGESSIVWSRIGQEDFTPDVGAQAGFRPLPMGGVVYKVRVLGDGVLAYGSKQIIALTPVSQPIPTFKLDPILNLGIVAEGAIGGDDHTHIFIDQVGWLWRITGQGKLEKLGYKEFMTSLEPSEIIISYDALNQEFYISDSSRCFLLTQWGLTEIHQRLTDYGVVNGVVQGLLSDNSNHEMRLVTDTLDMGYRAGKTLMTYEIGMDSSSGIDTAVDFRVDRMKEFERTRWTPVNAQGVSSQIINVNDFRLCLRSQLYEDAWLDYIKVRWKATDLRAQRGMFGLGKESA